MKRQKSIGLEESMIGYLEQQAAKERRSLSNLVEILLELGIKARYPEDNTDEHQKEAA